MRGSDVFTEDLLATTESFLAQVAPPPTGVMPLDRFEGLARAWLDLEFGKAAMLRSLELWGLREVRVRVDFTEPTGFR